MPFAPKEWQDGVDGGTPITAAELNNMNDGITAALPQMGEVKVSREQFNPAVVYGGVWEYMEDIHMFLGLHVYVRVEAEGDDAE